MNCGPINRSAEYKRTALTIAAQAFEIHDDETRAHLLVVASLYSKLSDLARLSVYIAPEETNNEQ